VIWVVVSINTTVSKNVKESKGVCSVSLVQIFIAKTWRNVEYSLYVSTVAPSAYCGCKEA